MATEKNNYTVESQGTEKVQDVKNPKLTKLINDF